MPENIGAAARAMANFGLKELRLVVPRDGWPNPRAYTLAGHASSILDAAKVFMSTREASADCTTLYATTARGREMVKPTLTPLEAMQTIAHATKGKSGFLFGPERTGLTNDDVTLCDALVTIPTASGQASLNVAQSVVVLCYQWFTHHTADVTPLVQTTGKQASPIAGKSPPASKEELSQFFDQLESALDAADFWNVAEKKPRMWLNLRNIFTRAALTEQEVRSLHGVIGVLGKSTK